MGKLKIILLDLAGSGYYVLAESGKDWVRLKQGPSNKATAKKLIESFRAQYEVSVIEHSDFYGRLPRGYTGRVL